MELAKKVVSERTKVFLGTGINEQDNAMLQALYSRSTASVEEHYKKVQRVGSGRFMAKYYVGYGHPSIADCGTVTLFFEGVSMLAAKAIQDHPLYNGQETSTRYINMVEQPMVYVFEGVEDSEAIRVQNRCKSFYEKHLEIVEASVAAKHPINVDENVEDYKRAVKARAFDIMRAWLPAGVTTNLSWHTSLRVAWDHLSQLAFHPLLEVRNLAQNAFELLAKKFPESFEHDLKRHVEEFKWFETVNAYKYEDFELKPLDMFITSTSEFLEIKHASCVYDLMSKRPPRARIPHWLGKTISITMTIPIDFGSFRDIQRHRNTPPTMPLLTPKRFHAWYLKELPQHVEDEGRKLISDVQNTWDQYMRVESNEGGNMRVELQYMIPMGFMVQYITRMPADAFVYMLELRSGKTVHPTLRHNVIELGKVFKHRFREWPIALDTDPDDWTVRRGKQTITEKTEVTP